MEKNFKKLNIDMFFIKRLLLLFKNNYFLGKNQIFFKKNIKFIKKMCENNVYIYKGNKFRAIKINYFHVGLMFGNLTFTRKPFKFILKNKINSKHIKR
jgi:ribosomal protein S19